MMKKPWFVLPGYCVGLGGLVLISYRTILAMSSPEKAILVSVNRFGEQYLDLVALGFLWVVCLVGLLCLSIWVKEMQRREQPEGARVRQSVGARPVFLSDDAGSFHPTPFVMIGESHHGFNSTKEASVSMDSISNSVSLSIVVQQEDSQG